MTKVNVNVDSDSFPEVISRVADSGERIVIEKQGKAIAAIIAYTDLKRLEVMEAALLKKAELEEFELLKAAARNPAFDFLKDPEEDTYTLNDGKPFHDPEWIRTAASNLSFGYQKDLEDTYTIADDKPFHDEG